MSSYLFHVDLVFDRMISNEFGRFTFIAEETIPPKKDHIREMFDILLKRD